MSNIKEISKCIEALSSTIETGFSSYADSNNSESVEIITSFNSHLSNFVKDVYSALNFSAITGEYVENLETEKDIIAVRAEMEDLITLIPAGSCAISDSLIRNIKLIVRDLRLYGFEIHLFRKSVDNPAYRYIDYDIENEDNINITDKATSIEIYSEIFIRNLHLMSIDREFILSRKTLYDLITLYGRLIELKEKRHLSYIDILIRKASLILSKFNYLNNVDELHQLYNYYDDREVEVPINENSILEHSILNSKLRNIYTKDESKYKNNIAKYYNEVKSSDISTWSTFIKCHYYKNVIKNEHLLKELIDDFNEYRKNLENSFDKRNAAYCLNYLYNCRLSFVLSNREMDLIGIWNEMMQIQNIQDSTGIHNYFPFLKIADWYDNFLKKEIQTITDLSILKSALNQFEKCVDIVADYLRESRNNAICFIPYKPILVECFDKYELNDKDINVFISTSYIVPVDYEREYKSLRKLQSSLINYKAVLCAQSSICTAISEVTDKSNAIQQNINTLKEYVDSKIEESQNINQNELKENQKNNVQILAIFAGIAMFVSGSIQIFQGAKDFKDASIFMLLFASAMSLFALLIFSVISNNKKINRLFVVVLIIVAFVSFLAILCWSTNDSRILFISLF